MIWWRGPAPWHFVRLPDDIGRELAARAGELSYGWGCIAVQGRIGSTEFTTAMFPKDGGYLLPIKVAVQRAEGVELGDEVDVSIRIGEAQE